MEKQIEWFKWGELSIKCMLLVWINILTPLRQFFCSEWHPVSIILVAFAVIQEVTLVGNGGWILAYIVLNFFHLFFFLSCGFLTVTGSVW